MKNYQTTRQLRQLTLATMILISAGGALEQEAMADICDTSATYAVSLTMRVTDSSNDQGRGDLEIYGFAEFYAMTASQGNDDDDEAILFASNHPSAWTVMKNNVNYAFHGTLSLDMIDDGNGGTSVVWWNIQLYDHDGGGNSDDRLGSVFAHQLDLPCGALDYSRVYNFSTPGQNLRVAVEIVRLDS